MASTTTWVCDRCNTTGEGSAALHLTVWGVKDVRGERQFDLCSDCLLAMVEWVDQGRDEAWLRPSFAFVVDCPKRHCKGSIRRSE